MLASTVDNLRAGLMRTSEIDVLTLPVGQVDHVDVADEHNDTVIRALAHFRW